MVFMLENYRNIQKQSQIFLPWFKSDIILQSIVHAAQAQKQTGVRSSFRKPSKRTFVVNIVHQSVFAESIMPRKMTHAGSNRRKRRHSQ